MDPSDPFSVSAPQSSSFRFDWRRDYVPIDAGFSLNEHGKLEPRGYPLVEILAAIGLANARPARLRKLEYRYGVVGRAHASDPAHLPLPFVRAALGCAPLPFPFRRFRMDLDWPGQENQARCITTVSEESA
jgi:CRISPR-associated protein Csx14